jgi:predicted site-specific integrase-resolvase
MREHLHTDDARADATPAGFLTTSQLLERLPISRRTLSTHRAKGLIPYILLGGRVLFCWDSVRAALLRQQRGGI